MKEQLIQLGLTEQEADAYISLLKNQKQTAANLAKSINMNRSVTYSILESLIKKGLISYVLINGIKHFSANGQNALQDFLKIREKAMQELIPKINSIKPSKGEMVTAEVFEGVKGGLEIMKDIIKEGEDYVAFGEDNAFQEVFGTLAEQYVRQLNEKGIKEKLLVPEGQKVLVSKYTQIKYLPKEIKLPSITAIYGDKVAIGIFQKPYYAILIKSKDLAESYLSIFNLLWKIAKK